MDALRLDATEPDRLSRRSCLLISAFGAVLFLVNFGPAWALTYHEAFFAEPAREMLLTGDWLIPRVAGHPSWQKPPLTHWLIAASMAIFRTEAEWAVRLPTLVATLLNALFVAALAARWLGDRVGRLTGLIQLTTYYALFMGRLAEADMPLCAAVSGGMYALSLATSGRGGRWARLAYFLAAGVSSLIKGPVGPAILGGAGLVLAVWERKRVVWRTLFDPIGLILLAVLGLAWPIAAYRVDPSLLDALRVHNVDRFTGAYDGREHPLFYAYILPSILLPWTPVMLAGLVGLWRDRDRPAFPWKLMICWFFVGLAIIQLSAWKHKHYPMPMLAPLSIVAACGLATYMKNARPLGRSPAGVMAVAMAGVGGVALVVGGCKGDVVTTFAGVFGMLAAAGLATAFRLRRAGRIAWTPACLFGTIGLIVVLNQTFVMPHFDQYRPQAELAGRINARVPEGSPICLVEVPSPQILFYLRHPFRRFDTGRDFTAWLGRREQAGEVFVVGPRLVAEKIMPLGRSEALDHADALTHITLLRLRPDPAPMASNPGANRK